MKFKIPQSIQETDLIINQAKEILKNEDFLWEFCYNLIILAGSFNRHITLQHREEMLQLLINNPEQSIGPVLQALLDNPRTEQFDLTKKFVLGLLK